MSAPPETGSRLWVMQLSLGVGLMMLVMKVYAYVITGSAAIFSDAAESIVHNVAVSFALFSLWYAHRPADPSHPYGHEKINYFSAGFEGSLIVLAAIYIIYESVHKWMAGLRLENLSAGIWFTFAAFAINGFLGAFLVWRGKKMQSLIVEANGHHVLTDSWTSLGVIVGLVLAKITGWLPFDPICAIVVAINILWSGGELMRRSVRGLMDEADPAVDREVREILAREITKYDVQFHELKHRKAGRSVWVEVHLLFPDETPLWLAHAQATEIENAIEHHMGANVAVTTHLEPAKDHGRVHGKAPAK